MGYRYNPLIYTGLDLTGGSSGGAPYFMPPVDTEGDLPSPGTDGEMRVVLDTDHIYVYNGDTALWRDTGMTEAVAFGTTPNDIGYDLEVEVQGGIERNVLVLQPADDTHPGAVSIDAQSFAGDKTFIDNVTVDNDITSGNSVHVENQLVLHKNGNFVAINADPLLALSYSLALPPDNGNPNQVLTTDGAGVLSWTDKGSPSDIPETSFTGVQSAASANVTGFVFASTVRTFDAIVDIQVDATTDLYEYKKLVGVHKGATWQLYVQSFGDDTDVDFTITSGGQIQYTSTTYPGFVSLQMRFRALTLSN